MYVLQTDDNHAKTALIITSHEQSSITATQKCIKQKRITICKDKPHTMLPHRLPHIGINRRIMMH